ncbi:MAG: family oxidoreductase [Bradyrhizobium sp.]|nr:family oxidoreductase [Bradyrhizobium sp.]
MAITLTYPEGGALVTGGTGRVGEGIVRQLSLAGVPLVFTYRGSAARAHELESELRTAGHRVWAQPMDMEDITSVQQALDRVVAECGRLSTVACGAGVTVGFNKIADFAVAEIERFVNGDALGYYRIFHAAIPMLRASGGGSIITCTTIATRRVIAYDGISPFSKGSVDALVRQVAAEEAGHNIRCNSVAIGWVESRTIAEVRAQTPPAPAEPKTEIDRMIVLMNQMLDIVRLGRPCTPEEAGNVFAFLASNQASYVTGQSIALDGGALL